MTDLALIDYQTLETALRESPNDTALFQTIVDAPFEQKVAMAWLFLGIAVLLLVDKQQQTINRVALSNTELAKNTQEVSPVPFEDIHIPLAGSGNIVRSAIRDNQVQDTTDWKFLFAPVLTPEQARINQAAAGIAYSAIYPLGARDGGALIFSYFQYQQEIGIAQREFMERYTVLVDRALNRGA